MKTYQRLRIFAHIFLGLLLGFFITALYLASSDRFKQFVEHAIEKQFEKDYGCAFQARLEQINWFDLSMVFSDVSIEPAFQSTLEKEAEQNWSIHAEKLCVKASWLKLITSRALHINLLFDHMALFELFEQKPQGLMRFIAKLFAGSDATFLVYRELSIADGALYLKQQSNDASLHIPFTSNIAFQPNTGTRFQIYANDGAFFYKEHSVISELAGTIFFDLLGNACSIEDIVGHMHMTYLLNMGSAEKQSFCAGKLERGVGEFAAKSEDGSLVIAPIKITHDQDHCWCTMQITSDGTLLAGLPLPDHALSIDGTLNIVCSGDLYNLFETFTLSVAFDDLCYLAKSIVPGGKVVIKEHTTDSFSGVLELAGVPVAQLVFTLEQGQRKLTLTNLCDVGPWPYGGYFIAQDGCVVHVTQDANSLQTSGDFSLNLVSVSGSQDQKITGTFVMRDGALIVDADMDDMHGESSVRFTPDIAFEKCSVTKRIIIDEQVIDKVMIDAHATGTDGKSIAGLIDFLMLHQLVPDTFKPSFVQDSSIAFSGTLKDGICYGQVSIDEGHIRVPMLYNVISSFTASCEIDARRKMMILKDVHMGWYEGSISCSRATFMFDQVSDAKNSNLFCCRFAHAPLMLDRLMFSFDRGMYMLLSGSVLLTKQSPDSLFHVDGQVMFEQAELKENLFSQQFQEMLSNIGHGSQNNSSGFDALYDISFFTKDALTISTSFLSSQALVDVRAQGSLQKPELSGKIQLLSGVLNFPYKPLEITQGSLLFVPEQPFDPMIELSAQAKLKRFNVTMHAWGSALDPHMQFEAQPYLTEEQIISLLLLGIEENSLGMMIPAFLTQKLKDIIFGPALGKTKLKEIFDKLLKSLRYFRFLPQFTDQTGRGGVKGVLEIDASDNLHGKIETNFAHLEDTKFDVDYAVTDDVTLRLQKDGPSTYGGQVEFRWKFS